MDKSYYYQQLHQTLAEEFETTPEVIEYVRQLYHSAKLQSVQMCLGHLKHRLYDLEPSDLGERRKNLYLLTSALLMKQSPKSFQRICTAQLVGNITDADNSRANKVAVGPDA